MHSFKNPFLQMINLSQKVTVNFQKNAIHNFNKTYVQQDIRKGSVASSKRKSNPELHKQ